MSRISGAKPEIDEHKADRENPHDVDDGQTGAADSLTNHEDSTGDVHGVGSGDSVAGQSDVDAVTTDLSNHSGSSSGVHGVGASNVESVSGAQSKADSAESSANTYTDNHENKNNPHSSSASDTDLSNHANDGTNPHGVSTTQIGALAASDYNPESDTHSPPTATAEAAQYGGFENLYSKSSQAYSIATEEETRTETVDAYTDELELSMNIIDTDLVWKSYTIRDDSGTTVASGSPGYDSTTSDTTISVLFSTALVSEIQYTFGGTPDNFGDVFVASISTDSRRLALPPHAHSI
jgi:hypothetical protein